jgi:hypothetical protein
MDRTSTNLRRGETGVRAASRDHWLHSRDPERVRLSPTGAGVVNVSQRVPGTRAHSATHRAPDCCVKVASDPVRRLSGSWSGSPQVDRPRRYHHRREAGHRCAVAHPEVHMVVGSPLGLSAPQPIYPRRSQVSGGQTLTLCHHVPSLALHGRRKWDQFRRGSVPSLKMHYAFRDGVPCAIWIAVSSLRDLTLT